ncbi:JmjC domain-containing protein [Frigoribacterium sp. CFBP 8751]|uniref:JmjC domain-containing protein n=1 Tax=Frigoribacterium sp. CFBP 8751 TaxID=2775277 RepID=UPI001786B831|nr:cupin domain-containing protein [Frigoribacterium sp. CFBP 8751]MBD8537516.1 cupin [Frigoribacterium sp. CFBP 8751]
MNSFDTILRALGGPDTFRAALGERHLVGTSPVDPSTLISWSDLDELVTTRRLVPPHLKVVNDGRSFPASAYLDQASSPRRRQQPVVDAGKLEAILSKGATLVINDLQEIAPRVTEAARALSELTHERVQANSYATWGKTRGFDPHWDDHDVLIVQVEGQKYWDIFGPGTRAPLDHQVDADNERPSLPVWSGNLFPGQVVYLPRGWWHAVRGSGDHSLHLTFGFQRRTGLDYFRSLIGHLEHEPAFREDLPAFGSPHEKEAHQQRLLGALSAVLANHDSQSFLDDFRQLLQPTPSLDLGAIASSRESESAQDAVDEQPTPASATA